MVERVTRMEYRGPIKALREKTALVRPFEPSDNNFLNFGAYISKMVMAQFDETEKEVEVNGIKTCPMYYWIPFTRDQFVPFKEGKKRGS